MIFSFDFHLLNVVRFRTILKKKIVLFVFISNIIRYTNIVFSIGLNILLIVNFFPFLSEFALCIPSFLSWDCKTDSYWYEERIFFYLTFLNKPKWLFWTYIKLLGSIWVTVLRPHQKTVPTVYKSNQTPEVFFFRSAFRTQSNI